MEVFFGHTVKFAQMSFGLIPKVFNAINVIGLVSKMFRMVKAIMLKICNVERVIGSIAIGIDNCCQA